MNRKYKSDGDFPTDTPCKYHCSPTRHPAQVGEEWVYGCLHKAWIQNREGDFCPIVDCGGNQSKCEIPLKLLKNRKNELQRRISNRRKTIEEYETKISEIDELIGERQGEYLITEDT